MNDPKPVIIAMDDPRATCLDERLEDVVIVMANRHNVDPVATASSAILLMSRQLALVQQEVAAQLLEAIAGEVRAGFTDPVHATARISLTSLLVKHSDAISRQVAAEVQEAREGGHVS